MNAVTETTLLSFEDVDLLVAMRGQGSPLIFIHGYTNDHDLWHESMAAFSREYRCVAYDVRGHGGSSSPMTGYGVHDHTDDLLRVMDSLEIPKASLIGLSMGGGIALSAALAHPERVDRLVLASSTVGGLPWEEGMWNYFRDFETASRNLGVQVAIDKVWINGPLFTSVKRYPALHRRLREMASRFSGGNIFDRAQYARPPVPDCDRLGEIRCPTLVIRGELDPPEFVRRAKLLAEKIAGARHEIIPGAGQFTNLEAPTLFNKVVHRFLKETGAHAAPNSLPAH
jgi:3-oxoadipate enol-lactonase